MREKSFCLRFEWAVIGHLETSIAIACRDGKPGFMVRKCRYWIGNTYVRSLTENKGETWLMAHQVSTGRERYL